MLDQYMRTGQGFLIVYSVTSPSSFHEVSQFRDQILRVKDADTVPIVIVGNKVRVLSCRLLQAAGVPRNAAIFVKRANPLAPLNLAHVDILLSSATSLMSAWCRPWRDATLRRALGCRSLSRLPRAA
jgi:hypothetical protein